MAYTHTRLFRIRHSECDPYGHVNNVHYLRYMQETAFDAATAVGYGLDGYTASGRVWLVRETEIEYLKPLRYGDSVIVKTWVEDFRRTRSRRVYELSRESDKEPVARATTDWVYVETATLRPTRIPAEMITAFGLTPDQEAAPRPKFPIAPPPPAGVFKMRRQVQFRELDGQHHVNNAVYLDYAMDCSLNVINAFGWSLAQMTARGFGILVRRHQIEYKQSAVMDDELEISTWVSGLRRASATRHYTIHRLRDNALIVQINSEYVWFDLMTGAPSRVPPDFIEAFAANIVK